MATIEEAFYALLMVVASGAIALHFAQDRSTVNVHRRTMILMNRLWKMRFEQGDKATEGAYEGRDRLLRDDVQRLDLYAPFILQKALDDGIYNRAGNRCDVLFKKLVAVDWVIPIDGELMKELEACEFEVTTASVVMVSTWFFISSFPSLLMLHSRKINGLGKGRGGGCVEQLLVSI